MNIKKDQVQGPVGPRLSLIFIIYDLHINYIRISKRSGPRASRPKVVLHLYPVLPFTHQLQMNSKKDLFLGPVGPKLSFISIQYNLHIYYI